MESDQCWTLNQSKVSLAFVRLLYSFHSLVSVKAIMSNSIMSNAIMSNAIMSNNVD